MAQSPSHKFGQIIGNLLESVAKPFLKEFCEARGLYLDYQDKKRKARKGKKVSWSDRYGNFHDLDFVIEKDGTDLEIGRPVAFIECAWRRYTKHSRNKAQEIQGAILPLAETHNWMNPFLGVILAGDFTEGSILQLKSRGFSVLYFQYETIVEAFSEEGINIRFEEATPDEEFEKCVNIIEDSSVRTIDRVKHRLIEKNRIKLDEFLEELADRFDRSVERIIIVALYGRASEFFSIEDAIHYIEGHKIFDVDGEFKKYEIIVSFSNGDKLEGIFKGKKKAEEFLKFVGARS